MRRMSHCSCAVAARRSSAATTYKLLMFLLLLALRSFPCILAHSEGSVCSTSCELPLRPQLPDKCLLEEVCPIGEASSSPTLSSRIRAELAVQSLLAGCADKLHPVGNNYEVHGIWTPGLFRSPGTERRVSLELQHLKPEQPLDRPIVIAILADVEDVGNMTVEIDTSWLNVTTHSLTILVSQGITLCHSGRHAVEIISNAMRKPSEAFRWLWNRHGLVHTFVAGLNRHLDSNIDHLTIHIGNGYDPKDDSTPTWSCNNVSKSHGEQEMELKLLSFLSIRRLSRVRNAKPAQTFTGCAIPASTATQCPTYNILQSTNRHLFVLEVAAPYDPMRPAVKTTDLSKKLIVEVDIVARLAKTSHHITVNVVLINRSQEPVHWDIGGYGLTNQSTLVIKLTGGKSTVSFGPAYKAKFSVDWLPGHYHLVKGHQLLDILQRDLRTTLTAYGKTTHADLFELFVPDTGQEGAADERCQETYAKQPTTCSQLHSTVQAQCDGDMFTVAVSLPGVQRLGWNTAGMTVTLGEQRECKLEAVLQGVGTGGGGGGGSGGDKRVLSLSVGHAKCGIVKRDKGVLKSEIVFRNVRCPIENCPDGNGGAGAGDEVNTRCGEYRENYRVPVRCSLEKRALKTGRLTAYRSEKFLTPHRSWAAARVGQRVYFELDAGDKVSKRGLMVYPVDCKFQSSSGSPRPVIQNGCHHPANAGRKASDITTILTPPPDNRVFRFSAVLPGRESGGAGNQGEQSGDNNPIVQLVCTVVHCAVHTNTTSHTLCERIHRNCINYGEPDYALLEAEVAVKASSSLFYIPPPSSPPPSSNSSYGNMGTAIPTQTNQDNLPGTAAPSPAAATQYDDTAGATGMPSLSVYTEVLGSGPTTRASEDDDSQPTVTGFSTLLLSVVTVSALMLGSVATLFATHLLRKRSAQQHVAKEERRRHSNLSHHENRSLAGQQRRGSAREQMAAGEMHSHQQHQHTDDHYHHHHPKLQSHKEISSLARSASTDTSVLSSSGNRSLSIATTTTSVPAASSCSEAESC
ncbi:uncharacterized protein LOC135829983 [Sycon ciliatum]|uniref:uncharacterized protein LOC135829983 n=1 Tax=Sycon ciliatum TaxID=27933 RepID=UPI0031F6FB21